MNSETTNTIEELGWIQKKGDRGFIKVILKTSLKNLFIV